MAPCAPAPYRFPDIDTQQTPGAMKLHGPCLHPAARPSLPASICCPAQFPRPCDTPPTIHAHVKTPSLCPLPGERHLEGWPPFHGGQGWGPLPITLKAILNYYNHETYVAPAWCCGSSFQPSRCHGSISKQRPVMNLKDSASGRSRMPWRPAIRPWLDSLAATAVLLGYDGGGRQFGCLPGCRLDQLRLSVMMMSPVGRLFQSSALNLDRAPQDMQCPRLRLLL